MRKEAGGEKGSVNDFSGINVSVLKIFLSLLTASLKKGIMKTMEMNDFSE